MPAILPINPLSDPSFPVAVGQVKGGKAWTYLDSS
jgi:hypothetical protein